MEKSQPPSYYGPPSAPETGYPQGGYPPPQGSGYPPQGAYSPQVGYPTSSQYPPSYQSQAGYQPQTGYQPQQGYPPQQGYQPQQGYPPPPGYPPQSGYAPQFGFEPKVGGPPPPQAPTVTVHVVQPEPYVPRRYGWCEDNQRNKPQSNSLAAATLIFTSGGMSLAWSVGFAPSYRYLSNGARTHMQICWFVAVIIGACLSTVLMDKVKKRIFNLVASTLVIVNGILFVSAPESVAAVVIARYCDGLAVGLSIIPAILAGSEQSVKRFRGMVLSTEQLGLATGIMIKAIYSNLWNSDWEFDSNQMQGILAIVYGCMALVFTFIFTRESASFFLRKESEAEAINALRLLQRPFTVTNETYATLNENKRLLEEDKTRGRAVNLASGLIPMLKLSLYRAFVGMSFSLPLTWGLALAAYVTNNAVWSVYVYTVMRMIGVVIATIFILDKVGRKMPTVVSLVVGGGLLFGIGSLFSSFYSVVQYENMESAMSLLIAYQVFAGIAAPASTCYLGEAFSVSVKPIFILVAIVIENVVQIVVCCSFQSTIYSASGYAYALGALQIAFAVLFFLTMPETKQTTLRQALQRFQKTLNMGTS